MVNTHKKTGRKKGKLVPIVVRDRRERVSKEKAQKKAEKKALRLAALTVGNVMVHDGQPPAYAAPMEEEEEEGASSAAPRTEGSVKLSKSQATTEGQTMEANTRQALRVLHKSGRVPMEDAPLSNNSEIYVEVEGKIAIKYDVDASFLSTEAPKPDVTLADVVPRSKAGKVPQLVAVMRKGKRCETLKSTLSYFLFGNPSKRTLVIYEVKRGIHDDSVVDWNNKGICFDIALKRLLAEKGLRRDQLRVVVILLFNGIDPSNPPLPPDTYYPRTEAGSSQVVSKKEGRRYTKQQPVSLTTKAASFWGDVDEFFAVWADGFNIVHWPSDLTELFTREDERKKMAAKVEAVEAKAKAAAAKTKAEMEAKVEAAEAKAKAEMAAKVEAVEAKAKAAAAKTKAAAAKTKAEMEAKVEAAEAKAKAAEAEIEHLRLLLGQRSLKKAKLAK